MVTLEQAMQRIAEELCERELRYRIASVENNQAVLDSPEDFFAFDIRDGDLGEQIFEAFSNKLHEFTTRTQAVKYLVTKGMSEPFAKAAIDQQFNYDPDFGDGVSDDKLRGMFEDLDIAGTQSFADLDMVKRTWDGMLTIEDDKICVDGEPTYDLNGDLL